MTKLYATMLSFVATAPKKDEKGATAVEYGLLVALIAAGIVVIVATLGDQILAGFTSVSGTLTDNGINDATP